MPKRESEMAIVRNMNRIDVQKLGLTMFLGSCIVIAAYLVSMRDSSGDQRCDLAFRVQNSSDTGASTKIQESEIKNKAEHLRKEAEKVSNESSPVVKDQKEAENVTYQPETKNEKEELSRKETEEVFNESPSIGHENKEDEPELKKPDGEIQEPKLQDKPICDLSHHRVDVCEMHGDVRIHGKSRSVVYLTNDSPSNEWNIRPHTIKSLPFIPQVSVRSTNDVAGAPRCTVNHSVPAIIFSDGGFTGNFWHDFADVLVPLFATARQFDGEVQLLLSQYMYWFIDYKYRSLIKRLSKYEVIDFDNDDQVRCFPHAIVSLFFHEILTIDPARAPNGLSTADFMKFLRETYSLKRDVTVNLNETPEKKPRLLIMARNGTRSFTNVEDIVRMAEQLDYEVVASDVSVPVNLTEFPIKDARLWANVSEIASIMNTFDVLMGVHGAGLTNFLFMPMHAVLIQVVPWGPLDEIAQKEFGEGAESAKLHYLQYKMSAEESTLRELYPEDHAVFTNPHSFEWEDMTRIFLREQNVKLDLQRFKPVLVKARELLHR